MILQLNPTIDVYAKGHGEGTAMFLIDYGTEVNSVWLVKFKGGIIKHFYSDDILIYSNPMEGNGWDVEVPENWK